MKTIEKILDITSGKETFVEREMTPLEIVAFEDAKKQREDFEKNQVAKAALLERLGITEEEVKLLLGGN